MIYLGWSGLTSLQKLYLNDNSIDALKPLENLINLRYLDLQNNCLYDTVPYGKDDDGNTLYYSNLGIIVELYEKSLTSVFLSGNGGIIDWTPVSDIGGWDSSSYSGW